MYLLLIKALDSTISILMQPSVGTELKFTHPSIKIIQEINPCVRKLSPRATFWHHEDEII